MAAKISWEKLPKFVQSLIVTITLVIIALVITLLLFDKAKDTGFLDYETEKMAFFVSGAIAVFVLVFMILSKEFRKISAVLTILGIVGLTGTYIITSDFKQNQKLALENSQNMIDVNKGNYELEASKENEIQYYEKQNKELLAQNESLTHKLREQEKLLQENQTPVAYSYDTNEQIKTLQSENEALAEELEGLKRQHNAEQQQWQRERENLINNINRQRKMLEMSEHNLGPVSEDGAFYSIGFPLTNEDKNFLSALLDLDNEYKRRRNQELIPEYRERAKQIYRETHP